MLLLLMLLLFKCNRKKNKKQKKKSEMRLVETRLKGGIEILYAARYEKSNEGYQRRHFKSARSATQRV